MRTKTDFQKPVPARERCIVLVNGRACGAETVYTRRGPYTGWYHKDTTITGHGAVPGSWI